MNRPAPKPLVTIGIPTYNRPEGLRETLRRVTSQTYENLEIIVSDNESSDEKAVREVISVFAGDSRLRFVRQAKNLGSIGNFAFLLNQAKGEYFLWAADDDEIEITYVEKLVAALQSNPEAAVAMTGYEVIDTMAMPPIHTQLTKYLYELRGETAFERLQRYIRQPDHLGKSRLVWGMFPTRLMQRAFRECLAAVPQGQSAIWGDIPIDFRILSYGNLEIVDELLFHVHLLPTSDGRQGFSGMVSKLWKIIDRSVEAYAHVVRDAALTEPQRQSLLKALENYRQKAKLQVFAYYGVIGRMPRLARWVKKIWFWFT